MKSNIADLPFPLKGLVSNTALDKQPPLTTPSASNVRGYDPRSGLDRGAQRSGLTKYMATQLNGSNPIQDLNHLTTNVGVPVINQGTMVVPLSSGGSYKLFDATSTAVQARGSAGDTFTCSCWDGSGNVYVGILDASSNLKISQVSSTGTVNWTTTLALAVGATPAGVFGMAWDGGSNIYVLGTGASMSPLVQIWKVTTGGTVVGGTYFLSEASAAAIVDQGSAQPSLNVLSYCNGFLLYPSAAHVVKLYNLVAATSTTFDLGSTNYGTGITDICTDRNAFFYVNGYNSGTPHSGIAKISTTGTVFFNIQNATVVYSLCFNPNVQQLGGMNTTVFQTLSALTGLQISGFTPASGTAWSVVRNSALGGFNIYAKATTNNFVQIGAGLVASIAIKTLVGNNINAGASVNEQVQSATLSKANIRSIGVAGGQIIRFDPAGPHTLTNGQSLSSGATVIFSAALFNKLYYSDGLQYVYYDAATDAVAALAATKGSLPVDAYGNCGRLLVTWRQRLCISGLPQDPSNWFFSAVGDATNWDYNPSPFVETQAIAGNNSTAGQTPDVINSMIPYNDEILLFGGDHTIYQMTGDPCAGGRIDLICDTIGIAYGQPWCRDGLGNLYFMSSRGSIYQFAPGALPQRISDSISELLVGTIDFSDTVVRMAWDERQMGFAVFISPTAGGATLNYFFDTRNQAWWQDTFATSTMQPFAVHVLQGFTPTDRVVLLGCQDGYIRYMNPAAQDDDGTAISSNVFMGPLRQKAGMPLYLADLQCQLGTGSGNAAYTIYSGNTAQNALASATAFTGTFAAGRSRSQAVRAFGHAHFVKLSSVGHTSWALEYLRAGVRIPEGKTRQRIWT